MASPDVKTTYIQLEWKQLLLAHTIIQVNKIYIRYPNDDQKRLAQTVERAKNSTKPGRVAAIMLSEQEKRVMRDYNTKYCCILRDCIKQLDAQDKDPDRIAQGIETYDLATKLHLLFASQ